jgi:outer membrane receptor protein involved in Fe transport
VQTGTVADPRALFRLFTEDFGERAQINDREVFRYVLGARGDLDRLGFIKNFDWELGYTYGRVEDVNNEIGTLDYERLAFAADAVNDVNNETGKGANSIVCRVQLLNARGIAIPQAATGANYALNDPVITGCTPFRIFGPNGATPAVLDYVNTPQLSTNRASQQDVLAFASGQLWDSGAPGPIGFAVGAEYREETSSGRGPQVRTSAARCSPTTSPISLRPRSTSPRSFGELRIPLLRDLPLVQLLELTATGRRSEYSTIGTSDTYGVSMQYKPSRDLLFRANYGRSVRAPNISELFQPLSQTFFNFVDTCSRQVIDATANPALRENRNKNCAALGVPVDYIDPQPAFTNAGRFGGNSLLEQEQSDSYTASVVLTPRFIRGFSLVLDGFNINIENAIATLGPQALLQNCTDLAALNPNACALITRDPVTFEITDFVQAALNFASLRTRGIDFNARYGFDLADIPSIGRDLGRVDLSLRGPT